MRIAAPLLLLAMGCSADGNGTAVGNPGQLDVYVQNVPEGLRLDEALFRVAAIQLVGCDRDVAILQLDTTFDALGPSPVEMPAGEWCSTVVLPDGEDSFLLEGVDADDEPFMLGLSPEPFVLEGAYVIDGNQVVVTLSLAESADDLLNTAGEEVDNEPAAPPEGPDTGSAAFEPDLLVPDGLFTDADGDGRSTDEALLASPTNAAVDCGCATSSAPGAWVIALAGILGWRRRR